MFRVLPAVLLLALGCGGGDEPDGPTCEVDGDPSMEIGVPDRFDFFLYADFDAMRSIPMSGAGQGGIGMMVALKVDNMFPDVLVQSSITWARPNEEDKVSDFEGPERLTCRDGQLYLVPIIMASEFLSLNVDELQGEEVTVEVTITDASMESVSAMTTGRLTSI